jgi:iron complex transport system substrate-binding protein
MRRRSLLAASLCATPAAAQRVVRDAAGRTATLPGRVGLVFPAGPPAAILLYTLAPDLLAGWTRATRPDEAAFLTAEAAALPEIGRLTGRDNTANVEAVLRHRPDLVLDYGDTGPTYVSLADRVQAQTGLPTLLLDGALERIPATYRQLGEILDRRLAAETLASAAQRILDAALTDADTLRARGRPRVYYARGPRGLETGLAGSINTEIIEFVGAENVATRLGPGGLAQVSPEQVLAWNPDWVLTTDRQFPDFARRDPLWSALPAVRANRLAVAGHLPFGWIDFPPSVNRLLGLLWLPVLFGLRAGVGLDALIANFHRVFYHREPPEAALAAMLAGALPPPR